MTQSFQALGLSAKLLRAVDEQGYSTPSPIQAQAIPIMLTGSDLLATAQTGTGKTAGFVLPILDRLAVEPRQKGARRRIRALILTPTRELAAQVEQNIQKLGAYAGFISTTIYGGVSMRAQIMMLQKGVDILVATPGRLLDHVQQKTIDLGAVEIFVLDEADRMLDMGFAPDVRRISSLLSSERQTAMFSATFSAQTRALANATLRSPKLVEVGRTDRAAELVEQQIYLIAQEQKAALLRHLIVSENLHQVLVFSKTKHGADRLAKVLERAGIDADAIHGDKRQIQRQKALARFKQGEMQALVATDVAARGIDISGLPCVINYDAPNTPEAYVHRIGRTGRAGVKGRAISLVTPADRAAFTAVERHLQCRIERRVPDGFVAHAPDAGAAPEREHHAGGRAERGHAPGRSERGQAVVRTERSSSAGKPARGRPTGRPGAERAAARPDRDGASGRAERRQGPGEKPARAGTGQRRGAEHPRAEAHADRSRRGAAHPSTKPAAPGGRRPLPREEGDAEVRGPGGRAVRARRAEAPEQRGEHSPKRRVGNVFRNKEGEAAGGKRQGFIGAIARFLGN